MTSAKFMQSYAKKQAKLCTSFELHERLLIGHETMEEEKKEIFAVVNAVFSGVNYHVRRTMCV
jgi:hypothetical protein